jgi:hypothetical protein
MEDNYPSTDLSVDHTSCQHVLKWIHNGNDGGLAKQDVMIEPLDSMKWCQRKFFNMGIIELRSNQASTQLINHIFLEKTILLNQDHTDGRLRSSQVQ